MHGNTPDSVLLLLVTNRLPLVQQSKVDWAKPTGSDERPESTGFANNLVRPPLLIQQPVCARNLYPTPDTHPTRSIQNLSP